MTYLLDTNIVTYILKKNVLVNNKLEEVRRLGQKAAILKKNEKISNKLEEVGFIGQEVFISCIAYYESKRGLIYANATRQLSDLNEVCRQYRVLFLDNIEIIEKACEIHANLKRRALPIQEADILIAATAITRGLILVSHDSDMQRVPGITLEDWLQPEF